MPDWSYRPLLRPLLLRLPAATARDATLRAIAALATVPPGRAAIDALGHMRPPAGIGRAAFGSTVAGPIGLSAGLDVGAVAPAALGRFGFGWLELGPVAVDPPRLPAPTRDVPGAALRFPAGLPAADADATRTRLARRRPPAGVRVAVRLRGAIWDEDGVVEELASLARSFASLVDALVVEAPPEPTGEIARQIAQHEGERAWHKPAITSPDVRAPTAGTDGGDADRRDDALLADRLARTLAACVAAADGAAAVLVALPPDVDAACADRWVALATASGATGVVLSGGVRDGRGGRVVGRPTLAATLAAVARIRAVAGHGVTIIAGDGAIAPGDALALLDAGADLVGLHAGLVFTGPGLPKRINEALLARASDRGIPAGASVRGTPARATGTSPPVAAPRHPWWLAHAGIAATMLAAGLLAGLVAATEVVLPYDLRWLGLSSAELAMINPLLLDFMAHDRLSLAGTMVSLGLLYGALTWFGVRRGIHWAARAMRISAVVGMASFFLFLAHGYLDPLHAVLTGMIASFYVIGRRWPTPAGADIPMPDLQNDAAWRRALVGQLALVMLAAGLIAGGTVIAFVGGSTVFVASDLAFMGVTAERLASFSPRLLPLIAHDRAGFGGALVANGLALGGLALWGFRRGARWVWWTVLAGGLPGFTATLAIHAAVGYTSALHLAPVLLAVGLYAAALAASREYLCARPHQLSRRRSGR